jgi:hypothetical protein
MAMAAGFTAVLGALLGIFLTGTVPTVLSTTGCGTQRVVQEAGFDPWTGQPHGPTMDVDCFGTLVEHWDVPAELAGRWGIPWATVLAIGGALLGAGAAMVSTRLPRVRRPASRQGAAAPHRSQANPDPRMSAARRFSKTCGQNGQSFSEITTTAVAFRKL